MMIHELESSELERGEGRFSPELLQQGFREAAAGMKDALRRGETYASQEAPLVESLRGGIEAHVEDFRQFASSLQQLLEPILGSLGEWGDTIREGFEVVLDGLERGAAWLKEHPDAVEAVLQVLVLAAFAVYQPEAFMELVSATPHVVTSRIDSLVEALS